MRAGLGHINYKDTSNLLIIIYIFVIILEPKSILSPNSMHSGRTNSVSVCIGQRRFNPIAQGATRRFIHRCHLSSGMDFSNSVMRSSRPKKPTSRKFRFNRIGLCSSFATPKPANFNSQGSDSRRIPKNNLHKFCTDDIDGKKFN